VSAKHKNGDNHGDTVGDLEHEKVDHRIHRRSKAPPGLIVLNGEKRKPPDRFLKRSSVRKGGEMLTDFNRTGFQIAGIIIAAFGGFMLCVLVGAIFAK
jgi:hypothetical protein